MRVLLACADDDRADWLAHVLGEAGFSVVVLAEVSPTTPELKRAEVIIADSEAAAALGEAGPRHRLLLSSRGSTVDLLAIKGRFADVLALPASEDEVVARVRHVIDH
jgi:hypothetical protein